MANAHDVAVFDWRFDELPTTGRDQPRPSCMIRNGEVSAIGLFTIIEPMFARIPEHGFACTGMDDIEEAIRISDTASGRVARSAFETVPA